MRRPAPLPDFMRSAAMDGGNPGLTIDGEGVMVLQANGTSTDIGVATEGVQLHFLLDCGKHLRFCTPHAINRQMDLVCRFCTPPEALEAEGLQSPSSHERAVFDALHTLGLSAGLRFEARLACWHGRIDFVHHPTAALIQVDGQVHFCGTMYNVPLATRRKRDVAMCEAAWREGRVLVRVHWRDADGGGGARLVADVLRGIAAGRAWGPLLVLSAGYNLPPISTPRRPGRLLSLLAALTEALPAAAHSDKQGRLWFEPDPLRKRPP